MNNVAHNNEGAGARFRLNNRHPHFSELVITYNNDLAGIETGAYINAIRYANLVLINDGLFHHGGSKIAELQKDVPFDGRGSFYDRVQVYARPG